jgi:hypothetical protein
MIPCEDFISGKTWQWEIDADRIKHAIGWFKITLRAQDFRAQYAREMDGTDGFLIRPAHLYWTTFVSAIKSQFLLSLEGQEAKNQLEAEK